MAEKDLEKKMQDPYVENKDPGLSQVNEAEYDATYEDYMESTDFDVSDEGYWQAVSEQETAEEQKRLDMSDEEYLKHIISIQQPPQFMEQEKKKRSKKRTLLLVVILVLVLALAFVIGGLGLGLYYYHRVSNHRIEVENMEVQEITAEDIAKGSGYQRTYTYDVTFQINGQDYELELTETDDRLFEENDQDTSHAQDYSLTLRYDPDQESPEDVLAEYSRTDYQTGKTYMNRDFISVQEALLD